MPQPLSEKMISTLSLPDSALDIDGAGPAVRKGVRHELRNRLVSTWRTVRGMSCMEVGLASTFERQPVFRRPAAAHPTCSVRSPRSKMRWSE